MDEQVEIDRSMLERAGAPLEHLLRNAVAHGVESPEERTHWALVYGFR